MVWSFAWGKLAGEDRTKILFISLGPGPSDVMKIGCVWKVGCSLTREPERMQRKGTFWWQGLRGEAWDP